MLLNFLRESNIDHRQLERDFQKNLGYKNNIRKFNPNIDPDDTLKNLRFLFFSKYKGNTVLIGVQTFEEICLFIHRGIEFHVQAEQE